MLTYKHRMLIRFQSLLAFCCSFWFIPFFVFILRVVMGYRIGALKDMRLAYRKLRQDHGNKPIIIAANHLTLIDSLIITWGMMSPQDYVLRFKSFPWNVPELANFGRNFFLRMMCYLGKCIYVERQGKLSSRKLSIEKLSYVLHLGHSICIFPEGGRSRRQRIDRESATYGVGQLIERHPEARVLCVYLRGASQDCFSNFPRAGERFYWDITSIKPQSQFTGRRMHRDVSLQIVDRLVQMEDSYFSHRQRHSRPSAKYASSTFR